MSLNILTAYRAEGGHPNSGYEGYIYGLRKLGHNVDWIDSGALQSAPKEGFDLLIQFDCCDIFGPPRDLKYPNVYWAYDTWQNPTNGRQLDYEPDGKFSRQEYYCNRARIANWTFNMSLVGVKNMRKCGVETFYLPIGADERLAISDNERRIKYYTLASCCNNWHMGHQNDRRGELQGFLQSKFPNTFLTSGVNYYEQTRIYGRAKIVWNYSPCGFDVLNFRVWEALISGTPFLTNNIVKNQLDLLGYTDRIMYYEDSETSLLDTANYIFEHYQHMAIMADDALKFTYAHHTMRHRMSEMLKIIGME